MNFTPVLSGTGLVGYNFLVRTRDEQQERLAQDAVIQRETEGFVENLANIRTVDDLLADRNALTVALGAFGLQDEIGNTGLLRQVLEADPSDSDSLPNRLSDTRYLELATAFNFGGEGGPQLEGATGTASAVVEQLGNYQTPDDLLLSDSSQDRAVLRQALAHFDLEQFSRNTDFLRSVLESDPADPNSFVNRMSNENLVRFAEAFDFAGKQASAPQGETTIYSFADAFRDEAANLESVDDLFDRPDLLEAALDLFGLEEAGDDLDYLRDVFNSDLDDENSVANLAEDPRFAALAGAFEFPDREAHAALIAATPDGEEPPEPFEGKLEDMINAAGEPLEEAGDYFVNFGFLLNAPDFFGLEFFDINEDVRGTTQNAYERDYLQRVLESDLSDPNSFANFVGARDPRFETFARAFDIPQPVTEEVFEYPDGFAQAILDRYLDQEFLTSVGEADPTMRFALGFEPGLESVVATTDNNDAQWFSVLASNPLREVFEVVLGLPSSFGALDIDRQARDIQDRTEAFFGTSDLSELLESENIETIRNRYLAQSSLDSSAGGGTSSVLLSLFA